jgi:hypothetical protein
MGIAHFFFLSLSFKNLEAVQKGGVLQVWSLGLQAKTMCMRKNDF